VGTVRGRGTPLERIIRALPGLLGAEAPVIEEGPRYHRAAEVAAHIVNLLAGDYPGGKAQLYARILLLIIDAMHRVQDDLDEGRYQPSEN
jgi:hypothetical protein